MTITIRLSDEEQRRLAERNGSDRADYIRLPIERDIEGPAAVDEALAPFRRQVEESAMTDEELGNFFVNLEK